MRSILGAVVTVALVSAAGGDDKKGPAPVGAALIRADGFEVGADFQKDARAAREKYTPRTAPKGVLGGTIVQVDSIVAHVTGDKQIQIATGNDWMVLLKGKVEGDGPYVTVTVEKVSVGINSKLVILEGPITRRKEQK